MEKEKLEMLEKEKVAKEEVKMKETRVMKR